MTLEEAKEILIEKGYSLKKVKNCHPSQVDYFIDKVLKCAVATVNANGYMVGCHDSEEFIDAANECNKTVVSDYAQFMKWAYEHYDDFLKSNDGQVDCQDGEHSKKIKELEEKNIRLSEKVSSLHSELGAERISNKVIAGKNKKIAFLKKRIKEKDEVIEDISEELRLSKVREDELIETVKDYLALVGDKDEEINKLKKELAQAKKRHFVKQKFMPHEAELAMKAPDSIVIVKAPF